MSKLIVVSNRVTPPEKGESAAGGLSVALAAALRQYSGIWFGWSGRTVPTFTGEATLANVDGVTTATIDLEEADYQEYYNGYANGTLWPLFHYRIDLTAYDRSFGQGYERVNRRFAESLAPFIEPDDVVWVHDYHLIPLAAALRRLSVTQPLGFFLHTPFPAAELLRLVPNHRDLASAFCAYDLVGFQTASDLHGFRDYLTRFAGAEDLGGGQLRAFGRTLRAAVFPVGIDVATVAAQAEAAERSRHWRRLEDSIGPRSLMIGVDRLDYSKGLEARFEAIERRLYRLVHAPR